MNSDGIPRRVALVFQDDGADKFGFQLEGDIGRLSMEQIPPSLYSPAEHFGLEALKMMKGLMDKEQSVKTLNREERRK